MVSKYSAQQKKIVNLERFRLLMVRNQNVLVMNRIIIISTKKAVLNVVRIITNNVNQGKKYIAKRSMSKNLILLALKRFVRIKKVLKTASVLIQRR